MFLIRRPSAVHVTPTVPLKCAANALDTIKRFQSSGKRDLFIYIKDGMRDLHRVYVDIKILEYYINLI